MKQRTAENYTTLKVFVSCSIHICAFSYDVTHLSEAYMIYSVIRNGGRLTCMILEIQALSTPLAFPRSSKDTDNVALSRWGIA